MGGNAKWRSRVVWVNDADGRKIPLRDADGKIVKVGVRQYNEQEKNILKNVQSQRRNGTLSRIGDRLRAGSQNNNPYSGNYPQERLDKAIWTDDKQKVDDVFRKSSGEWWNSLPDDQKDAAFRFTGSSYHDMNGLLGGKLKETDSGYDRAKKLVNNLTTALDSARTPEDIWVRRGVSTRHINRLFGISNLSTPITNEPKEILQAIADGKMLDVKNFMSTSGVNDSGFSGIEMKIFVPKGSKAVYAEPFSSMGLGGSRHWDGVTGQSSFSSEFEVLLQRGYKLKPIAYNPDGGRNGTHQIVFTVVGQESNQIS